MTLAHALVLLGFCLILSALEPWWKRMVLGLVLLAVGSLAAIFTTTAITQATTYLTT